MSDAGSSRTDTVRPQGRAAARSLLLGAATFVVVLDLAGIVILLPSVQAEFGSGIAGSTWVVAAFIIAAATTIPVGARAADIYGARGVLLAGLAAFGLASAAAAFAPSVAVLIAARVGQGLGVGLIEPAVQRLVRADGHGRDAKRDAQVQGLAALLAAALGPVLPAALATAVSWRIQFGLDVVLAAVVAAAAWRTLGATRRKAGASHDLLRDGLLAVVAAAAVGGLFFAVIEGPSLGAGPAPAIAAAIAALALLSVLLVVEMRRRRPLLALRLLRRRRFAAGNAVRGLTEFASLGVFFPLSGYLQDELGYSPLIAGLLLLPIILGALFTAPVAETYGASVHAAWFLVSGLVCTATGVFWLAHVAPGMPWWFVLAPLAVAGAGIGAVETPAELVVSDDTPAGDEDAAWPLERIFYLFGIGAGVAVVSAVWQSVGVGTASGVNSALLVCAVAALIGAAVAAVGTIGSSRAPS
ncbi:hypothetical protein CFK38_07425 [Brachybacterium vulturis]|uniref:Major facilitator superfamily (MFS) profile domain-containing protein n=1 Tax=Brachybacterium vulturis TaxID=2017484 RepID=A0A291GMD1_9MICO|nr:MFS transporter [Brachybacterium vulturis]ATG51375.1 hypothetical protein CFK38_07425 [Brachybacterium vulturis]